jgi:hypothetical protein
MHICFLLYVWFSNVSFPAWFWSRSRQNPVRFQHLRNPALQPMGQLTPQTYFYVAYIVLHLVSKFGVIWSSFALSRPSIVIHPNCGVLRDLGCVRWCPLSHAYICGLPPNLVGRFTMHICFFSGLCFVSCFFACLVLEHIWPDPNQISAPPEPSSAPVGQMTYTNLFLCYLPCVTPCVQVWGRLELICTF